MPLPARRVGCHADLASAPCLDDVRWMFRVEAPLNGEGSAVARAATGGTLGEGLYIGFRVLTCGSAAAFCDYPRLGFRMPGHRAE